jgi:hypothetical protein
LRRKGIGCEVIGFGFDNDTRDETVKPLLIKNIDELDLVLAPQVSDQACSVIPITALHIFSKRLSGKLCLRCKNETVKITKVLI